MKDCDECGGTGTAEGDVMCEACNGTGRVPK
jgi:DnaJ-class molecular chaperone